ncbi:histidine kinase [Streptomyces nojiriensis]|uniref:Histidine kinase n=1 Tax=Streptomyces nojiriensis TaxID=66374 RepID=A0ABQ3SUG8_9ACTN|nr:GAF domain-containing protein [Streptomyces nojiriensis]QTI45328.1 Oxygen sensor histidine kinase response regulator DosT [Streptomyces nojiriensis]GGR94992.1 histidine kinase [Streptomyces nojiriensis]GHI71788.1 histidine kinase [Streptomyces nojiriensis]
MRPQEPKEPKESEESEESYEPGEPDGPGEEAARLPALLEAVLNVGSELELHTTLQHIVDSATELCAARYGALGVVDPERVLLTQLFTAGLTEEERAAILHLPDARSGVLGALVSDPRPLLVDDVTEDPRAAGFPPGHPPMHSLLGVPIRVHTEVFGNLYLTEKRGGGPFTDEDLALLRVLASQAGIAIGNARLYDTARRRERWIDGAAAVTTTLLAGRPAADALRCVAERARLLADAAAGVVLQPTPEGGMEIVAASTQGDPGDLVGTAIAPGSPVLVQLLGGEPVFIDDSATDPRMTTHVRERFGPSMMLPLQSGGQLIGTLALPRARGGPAYDAVDRLLASQFASQAALALVLADAQHNREQLAVYEDRDRIARDLHDLVVQRLFATEMMLESTRRRAANAPSGDTVGDELGRAVDELDSTIQEVRTAIFALQQPPTDAPTTFRGRVLRETGGAAAVLGFQPSVHFAGAVDALLPDPVAVDLLGALRGALAAAHRRGEITFIDVQVEASPSRVRLTVADDGRTESGERGTTVTWESAL